MSRYYDPVVHRFINADGYFQAGGSILDANLSAYCGNNPVSRSDSTGERYEQYGAAGGGGFYVSGGGYGGGTGSSYVRTGLAVTATATLAYGASTAALCSEMLAIRRANSNTRSLSDSIDKTEKRNNEPTRIYRYVGTNPGNLSPKEKDLKDKRRLSFSTTAKYPSAVTTIEELNATGKVFAIQDGPTHVSVFPIDGAMEDWVSIGSGSEWTRAVKSVVTKWDGVK